MIIAPFALCQIYKQTRKISFCNSAHNLVAAAAFFYTAHNWQAVNFIINNLPAAAATESSGVTTINLESGVITITTGTSRRL